MCKYFLYFIVVHPPQSPGYSASCNLRRKPHVFSYATRKGAKVDSMAAFCLPSQSHSRKQSELKLVQAKFPGEKSLAPLRDGRASTADHANPFMRRCQTLVMPREVEGDGVATLATSSPTLFSRAAMTANNLKKHVGRVSY